MNNIQLKRKPLASWVAFALAATAVTGIAQAAAPLAGTEIKNLATVSYEDENGNKYTAQSNEAIITVAPQYRATLENDKNLTAAPGQTVYFPHTLANTGNVADTYDLTTADATGTALLPADGVKIYKDTNGNGQPDSGEPEITDLTLAPGEAGNIVVAYTIPATAVDGDETTIVLSATSNSTGAVVEDVGDNFDTEATGVDGTGAPLGDSTATNHDKVTITDGPVLVLNKESVIDTTAKTITYTLTVKNTGSATATDVDIMDALPMVDTDGDGTVDTQTTLVAGSIVTNGLMDAGDTVAAETDENTLGYDVNASGSADASTSVIHAVDSSIAPNTTVSVSYAVNYLDTWAAGAAIDNTFTAFEDSDNNNQPEPGEDPRSNTTHNEVPQNYSVIAKDDGTVNAPSAGVNDGHDDNADSSIDGTGDDDIQLVDTIAAGDIVVFTHTITNTGNGDDILNLTVANTDFPAGTVFTLWNEDGTVQLTDSDSDGVPDTGVLGQNESIKVVVKADLPSGVSKATASTAILTAASAGDDTKTDDTELTLSEITAPAVDLSAVGAVQPNAGFNDDGTQNAHDEGPVLLEQAVVGGTVTFPMSVANEAGSPDSFLLSYNNLPDDWSVVFKNTAGDVITATPYVPAGGTFDYVAEVTVSDDPTKALGDSIRAGDVDGNDETNTSTTPGSTPDLTNLDTDNDYGIDFIVTSAVDSGRTDSIRHAVDVTDIKEVTITPDGQNQIQPGGTVDYPHKLTNSGNVEETVELVPTNSDTDWSSTTLIEKVDGGVVTLVEVGTLLPGDEVKVYNPDGTTGTITLVDTKATPDGIVEFPLSPGQYINVIDKVFAPADAAQGETNTTTIQATNPDGTVRSESEDTSTVILGQVRLDKTVALDADCDMTADGPFAAIQSSKVEPGQCAIWQIVAKNEGDALVKNVVVTDSIPAYTSLLPNSLTLTNNAGATITPTEADTDNDEANVDANDKITFYVGDNAVPASDQGGELDPGETNTVTFTVKVDQ